MEVPAVDFVDAGGVRIAWQQFGSGPDVLAVPPFITNVEMVWENEFYRRFLEYIARHVRVTVFDKRGIGLSDKVSACPTLEQRCGDIVAVMDAAGLQRPVLVGASEGGLMTQLFAAQHPERVDRLVLLNSSPGASGFVQVFQARDGCLDRLAEYGPMWDHMLDTWGQDPQYCVERFCPSNADNAAFVRWFGRLQRYSATAADARRQFESLLDLDAADHLGSITAPTLIVNSFNDRLIPSECGRYLADRIPGAVSVVVDSPDHFPEATPSWQEITDTWLEFVTGSRPSRQSERQITTVVFTDIVDSAVQTSTAGDRSWRQRLDGHDRIAWATVERHGGSLVKTTGDGILARFNAPSQALDFAVQFRDAVADLGLHVRCGIHTGEVEIRENGDITGTAVNLAARVQATADDDGLFVSSTVHDLLLGGGYHFDDRGPHELKGFEEPWRLYALTS